MERKTKRFIQYISDEERISHPDKGKIKEK
jgi:hypothetical protein